jgi:hypothetical protein
MRKSIIALVLFSAANAASAAVINFDDLPGADTLPADYQGFSWSGWSYYDTVQLPYNPASGATRIYAETLSNSISSSTAFVFDGSYLSGYSSTAIPETVQYLLYNNGSLVFSSAIFNNLGATSTYYASGYSGLVNEVVYKYTYSDTGYFVVDNFTYNSTIPVPEPENLSLMLAGLGLAGWVRRRSQK